MKKLISGFLGIALLACGLVTPALAADVINTSGQGYSPNQAVVCIQNATASYTNATTTPTDIAGTLCPVPAYTGDFAKSFIRACFWADATKATATTGSIGVYVNGALVAASKRFIASAAGNGTVNGCYVVARSDGSAQTVKLQGVSADTNTLTVNNAVFEVDVIHTLK